MLVYNMIFCLLIDCIQAIGNTIVVVLCNQIGIERITSYGVMSDLLFSYIFKQHTYNRILSKFNKQHCDSSVNNHTNGYFYQYG